MYLFVLNWLVSKQFCKVCHCFSQCTHFPRYTFVPEDQSSHKKGDLGIGVLLFRKKSKSSFEWLDPASACPNQLLLNLHTHTKRAVLPKTAQWISGKGRTWSISLQFVRLLCLLSHAALAHLKLYLFPKEPSWARLLPWWLKSIHCACSVPNPVCREYRDYISWYLDKH